MNNNLVGKRVRKTRLTRKPKLSQDALSRKVAGCGVSIDRAGIAKIETGQRYVSDFEVKALAYSLDVSVGWLLGMKTKESSLPIPKKRPHKAAFRL